MCAGASFCAALPALTAVSALVLSVCAICAFVEEGDNCLRWYFVNPVFPVVLGNSHLAACLSSDPGPLPPTGHQSSLHVLISSFPVHVWE